MKQIKLDERALSEAIQNYLEDRGYHVEKLELALDHRTKEFYALAIVD
jgi:hypothetical protein